MATLPVDRDVIEIIAAEMASGVAAAVDCWMSEIDSALQNPGLTTLGRLQAVQEIIARYQFVTGQGSTGSHIYRREN